MYKRNFEKYLYARNGNTTLYTYLLIKAISSIRFLLKHQWTKKWKNSTINNVCTSGCKHSMVVRLLQFNVFGKKIVTPLGPLRRLEKKTSKNVNFSIF